MLFIFFSEWANNIANSKITNKIDERIAHLTT